MAAEKCLELVQNISNSSGQDLTANLHDLSVLVNSAPFNTRDIAVHIPIQVLFGCLKTTNDVQISDCKSILRKILQFEKPDASVTKYHDFVIEGMNHPSFEVRELCLSELERCSGTVNGVLALVDKEDILSYTVRSIADENLLCSQLACNVLINTAKHDSGLRVLFEHQLQSEFNELLLKNYVIRFRVFDMFINIQAHSVAAFDACKGSGLLEKLVNELDGDDILVQMNCLELLTSMASANQRGLEYLDEKGVVAKLNNLLVDSSSNPLMALIIPGIIKFFGSLAHQRPLEVTQHYPQFLEHIYSMVSCGDPALMPIAVETIGVIAHSEVGLQAIFNNAARNKHVMKTLLNHVTSSESELRVRALGALASIFHSDDTPSEDLSSFVSVLYSDMAPNPLECIFHVAKQPFEELRCSALRVIRCLAKYRWAQQEMVNCPGFLEYLLDRRTELEKSGKEHKYELVVELVHSPFAKEEFDRPYFLHLQEYEREGPFFARAQAAVAFEGAD